MSTLEEIRPNACLRGILPNSLVTVVNVHWHGSAAMELTYKGPDGKPGNELLYRHDEPRLEIVEQGRPWSFDGDGALFRLVSEALRIRLAHLFDPVLAVHTSVVEPLPHQITAVTKEISYWDHRAEQLKLQEQAGRSNARLNSGEARKRADELQTRLHKRIEEIRRERQLSAHGTWNHGFLGRRIRCTRCLEDGWFSFGEVRLGRGKDLEGETWQRAHIWEAAR